jgi:hypothetical protein
MLFDGELAGKISLGLRAPGDTGAADEPTTAVTS